MLWFRTPVLPAPHSSLMLYPDAHLPTGRCFLKNRLAQLQCVSLIGLRQQVVASFPPAGVPHSWL